MVCLKARRKDKLKIFFFASLRPACVRMRSRSLLACVFFLSLFRFFDRCTYLGLIDCFKLMITSVLQFCCLLCALRTHSVVMPQPQQQPRPDRQRPGRMGIHHSQQPEPGRPSPYGSAPDACWRLPMKAEQELLDPPMHIKKIQHVWSYSWARLFLPKAAEP